ncbi:MAG: hypothetical protein GY694_22045 [Gammaproteobacteria bacterium]|nr:hypothetical protein [Gammaproteobacteria bacterium]
MQVENSINQLINNSKAKSKAISDNHPLSQNSPERPDFNQFLSQKIGTQTSLQSPEPTYSKDSSIKLGALGTQNTTVAQLLLNHPELKSKTWSIIHNPVNHDKAFRKIPSGEAIFYNPKTQELSWSQANTPTKNPLVSAPSLNRGKEITSHSTENSGQRMSLGEINQSNPTISDLLSQKSDLKAERWGIIHSDINKNKAFTNIPNNTMIYMDSQTKELSWNTTPSTPSIAEKNSQKADSNTTENIVLAKKLDEAVKPYMGTEYKHLDCYTLVVNGLENMGIKYRGKHSLSSQLLQKAQHEGRANNTYFTGEGLTEAVGNKVYTKAISSVSNIDQQSKDIFSEMKGLMKKGDILSFSLQTKGHTGVISQNKDQWTYINSGRLDNAIEEDAPKHGVGEETLLNEINNWVKRAKVRNESLQITVGRLAEQKAV